MSAILWEPNPQTIKQSRMFHFLKAVNQKFSLSLKTYLQLHDWSIRHYQDFWNFYSNYSHIKFNKPADRILSQDFMPGCRWFEGAELNYAENLLQASPDKLAVISKLESGPLTYLTYGQLKKKVIQFASALQAIGIKPGDCVAGYLPNIPETLIAMLGCASMGAIWTSCSSDFGTQGVIDRLGQIQPKLLVCSDGYTYSGKTYSLEDRVKAIATEVKSLKYLVMIPLLKDSDQVPGVSIPAVTSWQSFLDKGRAEDFVFRSLPFNHPLFILYSSGTTGLPKCLVHGTGATLLQHHKEHALHTNIGAEDVVFYYTTCGWMMWNWLASVLAQQATIVLYDGSPAYPSLNLLWELVDEAKITVFGTSPKFLSMNQKKHISPKTISKLSTLKTILSTGAPLGEEEFFWVYEHVKKDVQLSSISGGTDIVSCFMLGNPMLPVRAGEIQCLGLGMDVIAADENNHPVKNKKGELVCRTPAPSMPLSFWNDPDYKKYRQAYFNRAPGMWMHGDFIEIKDHGGVVVFGRSDATLNPGGVRIGTAEIYSIVEKLDEVLDSLIIGLEEDNDVRMILFLVLQEAIKLEENLQNKLKKLLREGATPRHVPQEFYQVSEIPRTLNGKKMELMVKSVFKGEMVQNRAALANPGCLVEFKKIKSNRAVCQKKSKL
jgi:acetoacetyl-CoA synthetase